MKIGDLIQLWLRVKGITVQQFADELGLSKATVSRICNKKSVDADTLIVLINYFFLEAPCRNSLDIESQS